MENAKITTHRDSDGSHLRSRGIQQFRAQCGQRVEKSRTSGDGDMPGPECQESADRGLVHRGRVRNRHSQTQKWAVQSLCARSGEQHHGLLRQPAVQRVQGVAGQDAARDD